MQCVADIVVLSFAMQGSFCVLTDMMMIMMLQTGTEVKQEKGRECGYSLYFISLQ